MVNRKALIAARTTKKDRSTYTRPEGAANFDNMDDMNIVNQINILAGTVENTPTDAKHLVNKAYADAIGGFPEGTDVLSTGEVGATKFLREDGDGTCSWQAGGSGDMSAATYDPATISEQLVGLTATQTLTNKTMDDITNNIHANATHAKCRNVSGSTITAGSPVYLVGYNAGEDTINVDLADADNAAMMPAIGLMSSDLANNTNGLMVQSGDIENIDTSAWNVGDAIYVSTTAGVLTNTKPTGTAGIQKVGIVLRVHATLGRIELIGAGRTNDVPNITSNFMWLGNGSGVATPINFDDEVSLNPHVVANTAAKHTQNTDTALGSGAVAADHGTAATDQIINVSYGTSATPPTANTTTIGSLYIQYTA